MHGVFAACVTLDGEDVVDLRAGDRYLHRGMEKIAENRTNVMFVGLCEPLGLCRRHVTGDHVNA